MITFEDLNGVVDLSENGSKPDSVKVLLKDSMTVEPHEKKYITLNMQTNNTNPDVIFIGDSYDDSHEEEYWFLYTEVQPDGINNKIVLLNLTDKVLSFEAGDQLGVIETYYNRQIVEPTDPEGTITIKDLGDNVYSIRGLRIFDADNTAKDIRYTQTEDKEQITIEL